MATTATTTPIVAPAPVQVADSEYRKGKSRTKYNVNWFHTVLLILTPTLAFYGFLTTNLRWQTFVVAVIWYFLAGLGITAGYHRLFSHRAYKATWPVKAALLFFGGAAFQGSCKWWSRNHRAHHRFNDTDKDPYNVRKGFLWAHLGWMLVKQDYHKVGTADISDLSSDKMIEFQHRNYVLSAVLLGIVTPTLLCGFWCGDFRGGFFFACMARMVFLHHATFFVNSLAHTYGHRTYSDLQSAEDSWITAVLTLGEGYHNFHHEFPYDYRNGIRFYHYDPTKWLIAGLGYLGLVYDLQWESDTVIKAAMTQVQEREVQQKRHRLEHGSSHSDLPVISLATLHKRLSEGEQLVVIEGLVHNVQSFLDDHPGGRMTLLRYIGQDVSALFYGGVAPPEGQHFHTQLAQKMLLPMRVAKLQSQDIPLLQGINKKQQ